MASRKVMCAVYASQHHPEMYVYLPKSTPLATLPEALFSRFGVPRKVMEILLTPHKKLARADAQRVLDSIDERGFYLQMPPAEKENWFAEYRQGL